MAEGVSSELRLPSGKLVQLKDPNDVLWGDELHVISEGLRSAEEFSYAKCKALVVNMTRTEIAALNRRDGRALNREVTRLWALKEKDDDESELPKESTSQPESTDSRQESSNLAPKSS